MFPSSSHQFFITFFCKHCSYEKPFASACCMIVLSARALLGLLTLIAQGDGFSLLRPGGILVSESPLCSITGEVPNSHPSDRGSLIEDSFHQSENADHISVWSSGELRLLDLFIFRRFINVCLQGTQSTPQCVRAYFSPILVSQMLHLKHSSQNASPSARMA